MTNKKILGSFFIALIISTIISFGQNRVLAESCDPNTHFVRVTNDPSKDGYIQYVVQAVNNGFGSCPAGLQINITGSNGLPLDTIQLPDSTDMTGAALNGWVATSCVNPSEAVGSCTATKYEYTNRYTIPNGATGNIKLDLSNQVTGDFDDIPTQITYNPVNNNGGSGGSGGTGGGGSTAATPDPKLSPKYSGAQATTVIKSYIKNIYLFLFPLALVIGIIKILINLIQMSSSQGDPNKLNQIKEELFGTIVGIIVIGGAVTFINILGNALGL